MSYAFPHYNPIDAKLGIDAHFRVLRTCTYALRDLCKYVYTTITCTDVVVRCEDSGRASGGVGGVRYTGLVIVSRSSSLYLSILTVLPALMRFTSQVHNCSLYGMG